MDEAGEATFNSSLMGSTQTEAIMKFHSAAANTGEMAMVLDRAVWADAGSPKIYIDLLNENDEDITVDWIMYKFSDNGLVITEDGEAPTRAEIVNPMDEDASVSHRLVVRVIAEASTDLHVRVANFKAPVTQSIDDTNPLSTT